MRITGIRGSNIIGLRTIEQGFRHPVVLFCGPNGAGKSSVAAMVRMALTGATERVHLKKDLSQLVTDGAKEGEAVITLQDGTEKCALHFTLPDGKATPWPARPAFLDYCLDPVRFAMLDADARREMLFKLVGLKADGQAVMKRLLDRGCEAKHVETIGEYLKEGFPVAQAEAELRAREEKGAWRGVTGEAWGKDKGAAWEPKRPVFGANEVEILAKVQKDLAAALEAERLAGNALAGLQALADATPALQADPKKAARVEALAESLTAKSRERDEWQGKVNALKETMEAPAPLACPHCGGSIVQDGFLLKKYEGEAHARSEAKTKLPAAQESLRVMEVSVRSIARDLDEAREHRAKLAVQAEAKGKAPSTHEVQKADEAYRATQAKSAGLRAEEAALLEVQRQAAAADTKKADADAHHATVLAWLAIAEAVAPSGIPGELLASALKPVNDKLREAAVMTGWRQVAIGPEVDIRAEGRAYWLLSRSEQWRVNAMIAYAIASFGPRFLLLDELDLLDLNGRGEAVAWVTALVEQKRLDGAMFFATLKTTPTLEGVDVFWLQSGQVLELEKAA